MKHRLMHAFTFVMAALFALGTGPALADAAGPYYASPSWDQTLACTSSSNCLRFVVLSNFNSAAVLDRETGLVWERTPSFPNHLTTRLGAVITCWEATTGGRKGWRLPRVEEFMSLADLSTAPNGPLPAGHPFLNIFYDTVVNPNDIGYYWAIDLVPGSPAEAMAIRFQAFSLTPAIDLNIFPPSSTLGAWCVRNSMGTPFQQ